jgi:hypothetical protein
LNFLNAVKDLSVVRTNDVTWKESSSLEARSSKRYVCTQTIVPSGAQP